MDLNINLSSEHISPVWFAVTTELGDVSNLMISFLAFPVELGSVISRS